MTPKDEAQPTAREILDAIFRSQDVLASTIGRMQIDITSLKSDVAVLKTDVSILKTDVAILKTDVVELKGQMDRLERRVIRIDDRLSVIENLNPGPVLADHERRITRLEGL